MQRIHKEGLICVLFMVLFFLAIYLYNENNGSDRPFPLRQKSDYLLELKNTTLGSDAGRKPEVRDYQPTRKPTINPAEPGNTNAPDWLFQNPGLAQNDNVIVNYVRKYHLTPPSTNPYVLSNPDGNPSELWNELSPYLKLQKGATGFFIEAGANDGEYLSNTLQLERNQNWKGLLIEPNPLMLGKLRLRNRKAWIADVCLSYLDSPLKIEFYHRLDISNATGPVFTQGMGMLKHSDANPYPYTNQPRYDDYLHPKDFMFVGFVECFPLFSVLTALNVTEVDYMSLDIQGSELNVLRTIPFDIITIKVITVAFVLDPDSGAVMREFLESKNYTAVKILNNMEFLFVQKDYLKTL